MRRMKPWSALSENPQLLPFLAGLSRCVLAFGTFTIFPVLYPSMAAYRPLFIGYLIIALILQTMIYFGKGGWGRPMVGGIVDFAVLTLILHHVGSASSIFVILYTFGSILNMLVVGRVMGTLMAIIGVIMYATTLLLEATGVIPYAPGAPHWIAKTGPDLSAVFVLIALAAIANIGSAIVVGGLLTKIQQEERELERANRRLTDLSIRDPLTGLFNRRFLVEELNRALGLDGGEMRPFALAMIDLDNFKYVNDGHGHLIGDRLLVEIADGLAAAVRSDDIVCRFGGDEFLVVLFGVKDNLARERAEALAETVRTIGARFGDDVRVTASVGVTVAMPGDTVEDVIKRADDLAYLAKRASGDRVMDRAS
ncbi:MAG: GGDEF domain-containing protein [Sandaracinaceae bacterium]|nr:GGDEF domain-containing protein [Sandaracinaceae bacterium]